MSILFSFLGVSYVYRNPIYHQIVFAMIIFIAAGRLVYLLRWSETAKQIPIVTKQTITKLFVTGALLFGFGFVIWNMDNIFCDFLILRKLSIGWPFAFFLEGQLTPQLLMRT